MKNFTVEGKTYKAGATDTYRQPRHLTVNANGTYTYTPGGDWHGDILVSYVVTDGNMNGDTTGTLGLHIAAVDDAVDNIEKEHTGTVITTDVLANDSFVNPDKRSPISARANGTVTGPNNSLIYTPTPGLCR